MSRQYNPGRKVRIAKWLEGEPVQHGLKWYKKAELDCGHIVEVSVGLSPNHKRIGSKTERTTGRCIECMRKDVEP